MNSTLSKLKIALCSVIMAAGTASGADEYKLGYITDLSGPLAGSYTPVWEGFELYIDELNKAGGVNGKNIEVVVADDGLRADRSVAAAKRQIELDQVIGIFGLSLSSTHAPTFAETRKVGVPVVTSFSGILDALPPAQPYSYSTGVVFEVAGEVIGALTGEIVGSGKVVGVSIDSVGGRAALRHNELAAKKMGYEWDQVLFPVRTADFTPIAQAIVAMAPDVVVGHYGAEQNLGVVSALRQVGYTGPYVIASYGASEDTVRQAAKQSDNNNIYMMSRFAPVTETADGMPKFLEAAKTAGLDSPNSMHVTGWVLGMLVEQALVSCGSDCGREDLDKALSQIKVDTQGLTGGSIEFSANDHCGPTYWRLYKWDGESLAGVSDWYRKDGLEFSGQ
ncbi:ABC transporter substrate-binding protein [Mesorhizobium sp.]|uniref:ABC transporter substrate-binding protein n=1 Tax=Mesorhizobium sp. TaxID=1871066 RepID=UPI0025F63DE9|nr:ABC transporter substrate-binding protein [Mesorhizobium sp.]